MEEVNLFEADMRQLLTAIHDPRFADQFTSVYGKDEFEALRALSDDVKSSDIVSGMRLMSDSPYVFEGAIGERHFVDVPRVLGRITEKLGWDDVTLHVLRHTFASVAGDLGYSELTIRAMLGHASRGVTQRYIHIDDPLRTAADRTCEKINDLLHGEVKFQKEHGRAQGIRNGTTANR